MDGWKTISFPFGFQPIFGGELLNFQGVYVSFREGKGDEYAHPQTHAPVTKSKFSIDRSRVLPLCWIRGYFGDLWPLVGITSKIFKKKKCVGMFMF